MHIYYNYVIMRRYIWGGVYIHLACARAIIPSVKDKGAAGVCACVLACMGVHIVCLHVHVSVHMYIKHTLLSLL